MDCLKDRIVLKSVGAVESSASLFVNDLPGVTLENVSSLLNNDISNLLALWEKITLRALKKFEILVKARLNKCYRLTDSKVVECLVCEKKELFDVALWYLHGSELMIERTASDELSRFTTIDLEKAEQLKADFYAEFSDALDDAVSGINPEDSDCLTSCVECKQPVIWVSQTP